MSNLETHNENLAQESSLIQPALLGEWLQLGNTITDLYAKRESKLQALAMEVGHRTLSIMQDIFEGDDFPEAIAPLTTFTHYGRDDQYSYTQSVNNPFTSPDQAFQYNAVYKNGDTYRERIPMWRLLHDTELVVLHELGGSNIPEDVFFGTLTLPPLSISQVDAADAIDRDVIDLSVGTKPDGTRTRLYSLHDKVTPGYY